MPLDRIDRLAESVLRSDGCRCIEVEFKRSKTKERENKFGGQENFKMKNLYEKKKQIAFKVLWDNILEILKTTKFLPTFNCL